MFGGVLSIFLFVRIPELRGPLLGALILAGLAYALIKVVGRTGMLPSSRSSPFERVLLVGTRHEERPTDLEHFERALGWKLYSPSDFHVRVRPVLRRLLATRLRAERGIDIDRRPNAAQRHVDPELWRLVASQEMEPAVVEGSVSTIYIDRLLTKIERLG